MNQDAPNPFRDSRLDNSSSINPYGTDSLNPAILYSRPGSDVPIGNRPFPTAVRVIGIIFLVFGLIGIILGLFSIGQAVMYQYFSTEIDDAQAAGIIQAMKDMFYIYVTNGILNVVLSIAMVIASVGLVWRKRWGAQFGGIVAFMAIIYKLIESIGGGYAQWHMIEQMQAGLLAQQPQGLDPNIMRWSMLVGLVIGMVIFTAPLIAFYGWAAFYLRSASTRAHFTKPTPDPVPVDSGTYYAKP